MQLEGASLPSLCLYPAHQPLPPESGLLTLASEWYVYEGAGREMESHRERRDVANLVIIASVKASEGQLYRYPVTIRLIK